MAKERKIVNPGGINGTGKGIVNTNSQDYKDLQKIIQEHSNQQSPEDKIRYGLISLRFQMESYISDPNPKKIKDSGSFLKEHLRVIGVKNKSFAKFIDIEESNLSSILNGRRKINIELAFKLGQVFNIDPNVWLQIQSKNDLLTLDKKKIIENRKYDLKKLLNKAG